jgi:asparagine synthase (glutamine-hydrolysing)
MMNEELEVIELLTLVSKATKNAGITMALSGLGGDELFAGYIQSLKAGAKILKKLNLLEKVPLSLRKGIGNMLPRNERNSKISEILQLPNFEIENFYYLSRRVLLVDQIKRIYNSETNLEDRVKQLKSSVPSMGTSNHNLSRVSLAELTTYSVWKYEFPF